VKEYLSQQGIAYEEKDISTDDGAMEELRQRNRGITAVPATVVSGRVIVGFDENRFNKVFQ